MLPELLDHQDQNVRASSEGLTLELCRWIGKDPVKSILFEKLRDTMVLLFYLLFSILAFYASCKYDGWSSGFQEKRTASRACECY